MGRGCESVPTPKIWVLPSQNMRAPPLWVQLRQRVEERRREQLSRQGALRRQEGAVQR